MSQKSTSTWLYLVRSFPRSFASIAFFFLVAGGAEVVGAISIVPLLSGLLADGKASGGHLVTGTYKVLAFFGISPVLEAILLVMCGAVVVKGLLSFVAFKKVGDIEAEVVTSLRLLIVNGLLKARWPYFVSQETGRLTFALAGECGQVGAAIRVAGQLFSNLVQAVAYLLAGALLSWQVLVAGLVGGVFFSLLFKRLISYVRQAGMDQTRSLNAMTSTFTDTLLGAKPLKVMGVESSFIEYIKKQADSYMLAAKRYALGAGVVLSVQEPLIIVILSSVIYVFSAHVKVDPASFLAMAFFFHRILARFSSVQQSLQMYAAQEGALQSLRSKIDEINEWQEPRSDGVRVDLKERIVFSSVDYNYDEKNILEGFSIELPVGEITVVAGRSGAGKTTVADLVAALIRPGGGEIFIDDIPLSKVDVEHWRSQIGYVPQEVFLFNDTIRNNITLGRPFSDDDIYLAMEKSGLGAFFKDTGRVLDSVVGEQGRSLSGGQRQRLMIARALISKPKLLILDEATSGLDEETEREIWMHVSSQKGNMAILAISHHDHVNAVADSVRVL